MNMPGFTAHNSLCRSNQHYISGFFSSWSPAGTVVPTFSFPQGGGGDCHETCDECSYNCMKTCHDTCRQEPYQKPCCDSTETCCSGKCVNSKSDSVNCGACGNVCTNGKTCSNGVCSCRSGYKLCGNDCVDLSFDAHNCGACGRTCASGRCCGGKCCAAEFCCGDTCGGTLCNDGTCCPKGESCCAGGGCCPEGQPCCNTTFEGPVCCDHSCNQLFGVTYCT
jgi:hypothetical protein